MIEDCKAGKIDLIVTKSVSRFARNVVDCIKYARDLRALSPPVGIYFETENINTLCIVRRRLRKRWDFWTMHQTKRMEMISHEHLL